MKKDIRNLDFLSEGRCKFHFTVCQFGVVHDREAAATCSLIRTHLYLILRY